MKKLLVKYEIGDLKNWKDIRHILTTNGKYSFKKSENGTEIKDRDFGVLLGDFEILRHTSYLTVYPSESKQGKELEEIVNRFI